MLPPGTTRESKALFRGVTMMVPDRMIIIRVLLCAVGLSLPLFAQVYNIIPACEEQLSKQRHYISLRNILSVLHRGKTKRDNRDEEAILLYQTLRDMNLSRWLHRMFLCSLLLKDLFPSLSAPPWRNIKLLRMQLRLLWKTD